MTLVERALAVRTREDLVEFVEALHEAFNDNRDTWSNSDLSSFLGAMAAWSRDMEGFYRGRGEALSEVSPWRVMADILMAARIYE